MAAHGCRWICGFFFWGFTFFSFLVVSQNAILAELGLPESRLVLVPLFLYVVMLVGAVFTFRRQKAWVRQGGSIRSSFSCTCWDSGFGGSCAAMPSRDIALDAFGMLVVVCCYILGRREEVWRALTRPILLLATAGVLLAFRNTAIEEVIQDRSMLVEQAGYRPAYALMVVPLWAMIESRSRSRVLYYWSLALGLAAVYLQLVFRQAPGHGASDAVAARTDRDPAGFPEPVGRGLGALLAVAIALVVIGSEVGWDRTLERFLGAHGVEATLISENSRFGGGEGSGRRVGGARMDHGTGPGWIVRECDHRFGPPDDRGGGDRPERQQLHMGILYPLLKGGVPWMIVYFFPLLSMRGLLRRLPALDTVSQSAVVFGVIYFMFQLMEGPVTYSNAWDGIALGLVGGRVMAVVRGEVEEGADSELPPARSEGRA